MLGARPDDAGASDEKAVAFRERLVELGPAYIKLGQVLSTRPDLLPPTYVRELEHLQDAVPAMPFDEVEKIIESELGARNNKLFASFEETTPGSASLGQVHAAQLRDGRNVVVKVQRPGLREILAADIGRGRDETGYFDASGNVSVNVEPAPSTLSTVRSPPIPRARSRLIDSPSPTPASLPARPSLT